MPRCSICAKEYEGYGNNAQPVNRGRCCDYCNVTVVVLKRIIEGRKERVNGN